MKITRSFCGCLFFLWASLLFAGILQAQTPGFINRPATLPAGKAVLDPNNDNYSSASTSGFGSDDIATSELPYKLIRSFSTEPFGDLRRGPSHMYSDFVPDNGSNGVYLYYDATNFLFRFRLGSVMSGSKGYSILLDTDEKFGSSGASADPNYQAATTGTNGNPGFEIEIVLETNFRIAIYNVDGTSSPVLVKSYTAWQSMSQVSLAGTNDNGDPDFFMDFYIPFSDLMAAPFNLTASSNIRLSATTVMSPQPAIGGPKSDIYGVNDNDYPTAEEAYKKYIQSQPPFKASDYSSGGPGMKTLCTAPPAVASPLSTGVQTISGTWSKSSISTVGITTITVYKNGGSIGTVSNVSSDGNWSLAGVTLVDGDIITAKAQSTGESMCLVSNAVAASLCNNSNKPAQPALTCANNYGKGISGNNLTTGWRIYVENVTRGTIENNVDNPSQFTVSGTSPNITWNYAGGCNGGPNMPSGSYRVYYVNAGGCLSEPVLFCLANGSGASNNLAGTSATPSMTSPLALTPGTTTISGTGEANSLVRLYVDGLVVQTVTASGAGLFNFNGLSLANGQQVYITNVLNTGVVSTSKCYAQSATYTVRCQTTAPLITTDNNGQIASGSAITGISAEPAGTLVRVYTSGNVLVATTPVQTGGGWSTAHAATTPSAYTAVAGTAYYATAQNGTCGLSTASSNASALAPTGSSRCGSITGPIASSATLVSGSLTGSFTTTTVNLYLDGVNIGTTTTNTASWGPVAVNTTTANTLYANGVLTIGVQESGKQEVSCPASATAISCAAAPPAPVVSPANMTISQNQTVTYTISNALSGNFYALADAVTGRSLGTGKWAVSNGSLTLTTSAFTSSGTYNVIVKATNVSGVTVCTSLPGAASVAVNPIILPVRFLSLSATAVSVGAKITWKVSGEQNVSYYEVERSGDGSQFFTVGRMMPGAPSSSARQYELTDHAPIGGKVYFRIRETDADGSVHYSSVVSLVAATRFSSSLLPNPAKGSTALQVNSPLSQVFTVELLDGNTRVLMQKKWAVTPGANQLTLDGLSQYAKGQYLVHIYNAQENIYLKLMVQ